MELLVVRHAPVHSRESFGGEDELRPLTDAGRRRMRRCARGLRGLVPRIDRLAASPLLRARETADILAAAYPDLEVVTCPALAPGHPAEELTEWLRASSSAPVLAVVGHEPQTSELVSWFAAARKTPFARIGRGGAALLGFRGDVEPGGASLRWLLRPSQLRALG
ncbi:MAG: histidine phosphatase family protein [Myxococcota bacterium]|nr:histidine phosphatase family protein [Myxococcota bacterium]